MAKTQICSIAGCGKPTKGRGWCAAHYHRWTRHGDPLGGGSFYGEAAQFYRDVVLPHHGTECLIWPYARMGNGYAELRVDGRARLVHRMVCIAVHGEPPTPKHEAAHSCGRGHDACVNSDHLRWATPAENIQDQILHGTRHRGDRTGTSRLSADDVRAIRAAERVTYAELGRRYGVSEATVRDAVSRRTWAWLE